MTVQILIGDRGKTLGPLKPSGRISVNGHAMDASSEGVWIDSDTDVVIVSGTLRQVVVRVTSSDGETIPNKGKLLPEETEIETTPLQSPPAWVEQINAPVLGVVIGTALMVCVWLSGTPFTLSALLVPLSGAVAGWLFQAFVGTAVQSVGPREDHRPLAKGTALTVLICSLIGTVFGLNLGFGFLGCSCGMALGAFAGGELGSLGTLLLSG